MIMLTLQGVMLLKIQQYLATFACKSIIVDATHDKTVLVTHRKKIHNVVSVTAVTELNPSVILVPKCHSRRQAYTY